VLKPVMKDRGKDGQEAAGGKTRLVSKERSVSKAEPGQEAKSEFGKHILSVVWV